MNSAWFLMLQFLAVLSSSDAQDYVLEVLAVLDKSTIEKWQTNAGTLENVEEEVRSVFVEINEIWKSLKTYGVHVEVRLLNILMWNEDIVPVNKRTYTNEIDALSALQIFKNWVNDRSESFDHALYFTANDLVSDDTDGGGNVMGYAYEGEICGRLGLSVVEATTDYRAIVNAAHELGHTLGSVHDGQENDCDPGSEYLMSPNKNPGTKNKWFFSSCSARQIKAKLKSLRPNCLNARHTTAEPVKAPRLGELIDGEEQCRRFLGTYLSRRAYETYGDNFCTQLSCHLKYINGRYHWTSIEMAEGTPCGENKRCFHGKCVITSNGIATMTDRCPYGDAPEVFGERMGTCSKIARRKNICLDQFWQFLCCDSCS